MIQYTWIGPKLMANMRSVVGEPHMGCVLMVDFNRLVLGGKESDHGRQNFMGLLFWGLNMCRFVSNIWIVHQPETMIHLGTI